MTGDRAGRVVSVGGGKGAGKSMVAANLAVALAQAGARVVLVDADGATPSQHGFFGVPRPGPGAGSALEGPLDLAAGAVESGVAGLRLVALGGQVAGDGPRLYRGLRALDAEVVVVDVGAGEPSEVLERFDAADLRLVVTTPDQSSAADSYALLAGVALRELHRGAAAVGLLDRVEGAVARAEDGEGTARILARLAVEDPALAADLEARLAALGVRVIGNLILSLRETGMVYALSRMAREFLGLDAPVLGSMRAARRVHEPGRPYLLRAEAEGEDTAATLRTMAQAVRAALLTRSGGSRWTDPGSAAPPARALRLPGALPVDVAAYEQGYQRHLVDLPVTLLHAGGRRPARLQDVSEGGALCELDQPPPAGARVALLVPGLAEPAGIPCEVRHAPEGKRRAGLQFQLSREEGRRLAQAVRMLGLDGLLGAKK